MDNLARTAACPNSLPYFNVATTSHTTIQQQGQVTGGLGWTLVTAAATGFTQLFGKTVLTSETLGFQLNQQNIDAWDTAPSLDPIQLIAMQGLYNKALGIPMSQSQVATLFALYNPKISSSLIAPKPKPPAEATRGADKATLEADRAAAEADRAAAEAAKAAAPHKLSPEYLSILCGMYEELGPGWLHVTPKKCLPNDACYVAREKDTYVWVTKDGMAQLTNLTILIIDAATRDTSQESGGSRTPQQQRAPLIPPAATL
jgi:hypothetical protein